MYLPAFPALEADLGSGWGGAQVTLAAWFVGLAVGQLVQGTLADRLGRWRPLVLGTALYTLASVGCALALNMPALTAWRCAAAFGGGGVPLSPAPWCVTALTGLRRRG